MRPTFRLLCTLLCALLLLFPSASCKRGPKTKLEPIDEIVRKTDVAPPPEPVKRRSEEHTSELQSRQYLVCRLLLEKKELVSPPARWQQDVGGHGLASS